MTPRHPSRAAAWTATLMLLANGLASAQDTQRKYLLDRVDDAAVVQVYADGFAKLPLKQKMLAWHLYQAAIAGRDIYYDQRYAHSLAMRDTFEAVIRHPEGVDPEALAHIQKYAKLFWINSGPFNNLTARKFVLGGTPQQFKKAVVQAAANGAKLPTHEGETPAALCDRLEAMFFGEHFDPIVTNKSPGPGNDILACSANNLYVGVTMADLEGFEEKNGLNSRLVKDPDGSLREEVYRVGGMYDAQIRHIVKHLAAAIEYADEPTAAALSALIRWYTTGDDADRKAYDIAWVADQNAPIDTVNGFIEVYMDPRGVKGSWESVVSYVNPEKTEAIKKLAAAAQWFEDHMPWIPEYRKENVRGITANAIEVIIETGDSGPVTPIGINLPNDQDVREQHGSKSVSLANVIEAYDRSSPSSYRVEFSWTPEEAARAEKWGSLSQELLVNMHEVIGHASGRLAESMKDKQPQDLIKEHYSALEEARADLVALYFMADPYLVELGLVAAEDLQEMALAAYESYTRNGLVQLRKVRDGDQIEEDHMRNRQMIVRWLLANSKAIEQRSRDGKTYYVMVDSEAFREGVGRLLAEVQRIKSEGDYAAASALFENYGIHFEPALRDEIVARVETLDLASYTGFVMPRLEPVRNDAGEITDIAISYPCDLTAQMLEYSRMGRADHDAP